MFSICRDSPQHGSKSSITITILLYYCCLLALVGQINGSALNASYYHNEVKKTEQHLPLQFVDQDLENAIEEMVGLRRKAKAKNLTDISWAHAVNSQNLLQEALTGDIDFIEADIVLGKLNGQGEDLPVMAHPPATISDITLEDFLYQIKDYNDAHEGMEKGVKLDFKSIEVFEGSLDILDVTIPNMAYPIWLNADILSGPVNQINTVPVDPDRFFAGCMRYKQAVLSIGWTTNWGADFREGEYTAEQCDAMLATLKFNNVLSMEKPMGITFPVRAGIAANSAEQLHNLVAAVNETNQSTLTIWSSNGDYVDVPLLRKLIFSFGVERVYLDVPEELASQLNLGNSGNGASTFKSLASFGFVSLCFWAVSNWLQRI